MPRSAARARNVDVCARAAERSPGRRRTRPSRRSARARARRRCATTTIATCGSSRAISSTASCDRDGVRRHLVARARRARRAARAAPPRPRPRSGPAGCVSLVLAPVGGHRDVYYTSPRRGPETRRGISAPQTPAHTHPRTGKGVEHRSSISRAAQATRAYPPTRRPRGPCARGPRGCSSATTATATARPARRSWSASCRSRASSPAATSAAASRSTTSSRSPRSAC